MSRPLDTSQPLGRLMVARGVRQWDICRDLDIPPRTFRAYAFGEVTPPADRAAAIARYFGTTAREIFPRETYGEFGRGRIGESRRRYQGV